VSPALPTPSKIDLLLPKVWGVLTVLLGLFAVGAVNDPDMFASLGLPAGTMGVVTAYLAVIKGDKNTEISKNANPTHLVGEDGHLDLEKTIRKLAGNAAENNNIALASALLAVLPPQQGEK
jgi:hypothetical protein